ncbi:MAG: peptidylprolyl isomerase [Bacteroidaceae bacterium]|nr:peptidylprolyl isomerase [Bacteroidaceae bacterium]
MNFKTLFIWMALAASSVAAQVEDPVLMTVNGTPVHRSEFEYAFNKNNGNLSEKGQSVEEYLPMYVDFKLKVEEAKALRLDTVSSLIAEYKRDRDQLAEGYLTDPGFVDSEAYRIYAKDSATIGKDGFLKVAHIVFLAKQKSDEAAVSRAKAQIDSAYVMLSQGKTFSEIAEYFKLQPRSVEPFEIIKGQAYAEFEQVAFALADGEYSKPFESPAGFHIVKRLSSRPFGSFEEYKPAIVNMLEQRDIKTEARLRKGRELVKEFGGGITPEEALAREDSLLETKYPEFGNLMREYYDGLLFFAVSTREVWNKASADEAGLKKFFKKNKKNYKFETPRYRGAVIYANSQENLDSIKAVLEGKPHDEYKAIIEKNIAKDSVRAARVELGVYAIGDNGWVDKIVFSQGDGGKKRLGFGLVDVVGTVIDKPETYKDVKGVVVNDYQKFLEDKWVKLLRKKYKVVVDREVLKSVNNHN